MVKKKKLTGACDPNIPSHVKREWGGRPPKPGAPTTYTKEKAGHLCNLIAKGATLKTACLEVLGHQHDSVIWGWMDRHPWFREEYRRARRRQAHVLIDEAVAAAREAVDKDSGYAARVRGDVFLRAAEAWSPQEFGRHAVPGGNVNIQINTSLDTPALKGQGYTITVDSEPDKDLISAPQPGTKAAHPDLSPDRQE